MSAERPPRAYIAPMSTASPPRATATGEHLFYDGECGLCHRWVLFTLKRERGRALFRYAPLQGPTFERVVPAEARAALPDSIVVRTEDGRLLVRSAAVRHVLARIGGFWGFAGFLYGLVPRFLRDWGYDCVARVRKRLFAKPEAACPLVPRELAQRFDP